MAEVPKMRGNLMDVPDAREERQLIYPPVYYPGTLAADDAQVVLLEAGQEVSVAIALVPARAADVSGRVVRSDGSPGQGYMLLKDQEYERSFEAARQTEIADGKFTFFDVRPGESLDLPRHFPG